MKKCMFKFDFDYDKEKLLKESQLLNYTPVNYNNFLFIDMSSTNNFKNYVDQPENASYFLNDIRNNLIKNMVNYDLMHMMINKFIIDKKNYSSIPIEGDYNDIFLELRFIFLKSDIINNFKSIISKYQIIVKNISCYEYVNNYNNAEQKNLFSLTYELSNGFNEKEIFFINKSSQNKGFFEKFFNLFS